MYSSPRVIIRTSAYRTAGEQMILAVTLFLALLIIAVTATATVCTSVLFIGIVLVMAYTSSRSHHLQLMQQAHPVRSDTAPELAALVERCAARLQPGLVEVYLTRSRQLNAYTFGLETPKVLVLYSALLQVMDADELSFIIGHEMGHVRLGHTWLNSLVGGMAGIPGASGASALLQLAFLWWNRACELSADRAGLLACARPEKAITALIKLEAGPAGLSQAGLDRAYQAIDAEDDTWLGGLSEAFATHPMLIRRINELRRYAAGAEYRRLQSLVDQNLS